MNIGLIDVDGHSFPNFALMRLSAWHKAHGDSIEWADAMFGSGYDRVYKSKIFTFSPDDATSWGCEVVCGGTGYDVKSRLPEEVEQSTLMYYSLYPQYDFSIQFFSRGCIRHCPFCLVHGKEVFEGDVLEACYKYDLLGYNGGVDPDNDCICYGVVEFDNDALQWVLNIHKAEYPISKQIEEDGCSLFPLQIFGHEYGYDNCNLKIIGNRFDNPSLISNKQ